jgi:hypothetical protein
MHGTGPTRRPEIDFLLETRIEGMRYTLEELSQIARRFEDRRRRGISRQRMERYLRATDQHETWKTIREQAKQEREELTETRKHLTATVFQLMLKKAEEDETEKGTAVRVYFSRKYHSKTPRKDNKRPITFEELLVFYKTYFDVRKQDKLLSLKELGVTIDRHPTTAKYLLSEAGLEALYGKKNRHTVPEYKKQAIKRAFSLPMTAVDIAYFLELGTHSVIELFHSTGPRPVYSPIKIFEQDRETHKFGNRYLTYRQASQIYELLDFGFTETDICNEYPEQFIEYSTEHRNEIEPLIIHALDTLYPEFRHRKPYLEKHSSKTIAQIHEALDIGFTIPETAEYAECSTHLVRKARALRADYR